jgi:hypothetical protein
VNTILLCARHQKRITDDVLNVSKLSAGLITLVERDFSPFVEVKNTVRMFRDEVSARGLSLHFDKDDSMDTLKVDRVSGDGGRLVCYVAVSHLSRLNQRLVAGSYRSSCKLASDMGSRFNQTDYVFPSATKKPAVQRYQVHRDRLSARHSRTTRRRPCTEGPRACMVRDAARRPAADVPGRPSGGEG